MIFTALLACALGSPGVLPTTTLEVGGERIRVEVADDAGERSIGLMYRDALGADDGMLFVYDDERERSFWMKDTRVPLTIAYLDASGTIVSLADMQPLTRTPVPSGRPARYALEMNRGWFAAHDVKPGDRVAGLPAPK